MSWCVPLCVRVHVYVCMPVCVRVFIRRCVCVRLVPSVCVPECVSQCVRSSAVLTGHTSLSFVCGSEVGALFPGCSLSPCHIRAVPYMCVRVRVCVCVLTLWLSAPRLDPLLPAGRPSIRRAQPADRRRRAGRRRRVRVSGDTGSAAFAPRQANRAR